MNRSALDALLDPLRERGNDIIIVDDDGPHTAHALLERSVAWALRLQAHGLAPHSPVAAITTACFETVAMVLGIYRAGLIYVPINPRYRNAELCHVVNDCGATLLICDRAQADDRLDALPTSLIVWDLDPTPTEAVSLDPTRSIRDQTTAVLIYTSGTTGPSKGVQLSLRGIVDNISALTQLWRWSQDDILSLALPLFHVHGLCIGIHGALIYGMTIRLHSRFEPSSIVDDFARGATIFMGVPTMYDRLLDYLDTHRSQAQVLARARLFTSGSAALRPALLERWESLTGHRILERYGMSETLITLSSPYDGERRPGSVGHPVPGCEIRIVDDDGHDVPIGESGELWVRGSHLMLGYWGRPDATRAVLTDGWFRTGDMVVTDPDAYVRIIGRRSVDIIKSGGFKIAAPEIEEVLRQHPQVREAAVVGVPDHRWGERIAAAVVAASPDDPPSAELLGEWVTQHLADYKKPKQIRWVTHLPRNAMGKVLKPQVRAELRRPEDPSD